MEASVNIDALAEGASPSASALRIENLSKHFGGAAALSDVTLDVRCGEVHGLLGQNGSGKSTLIKILAGFHAPDPGARLHVGGRPVPLPLAPGAFRELGIAFVHQHLGLIPSLSVLENLLVGEHAVSGNWAVRWGAQTRRAKELFRRFGLDIDPATPVERLAPVERAMLAIVRAFDQLERTEGAATRLLILDEPTPFLPAEDVSKLFRLVRNVVAEGASVIFVSHDLDEIYEITDRVSVLRDGQLAGELVTREADRAEIIRLIVGRHVELSAMRPAPADGAKALEVTGLSGGPLSGFAMEARAGEVVGITGLMGSGYDTVVQLCFGAQRASAGSMTLNGASHDLTRISPHEAVRSGVVFIPSDRLHAGIVPSLSVADNVTLPVLDNMGGNRFLSRSAMRATAVERNEAMDVRPRNTDLLMSALSGGNQQKVVLAKWFQIAPKLILLDEPTQGVDVGAREKVFTEIGRMAAGGATVLCASSDHEQLAAICNRVIVLSRGRIVATLEGDAITKSAIAEACYTTSQPVNQIQ